MASSSSSSSSRPSFAPREYDVFISFRGEDTRYNFTSHLHAGLTHASLKAFRDDEHLERGDEIAPSLIQAIKDSCVSIVVFSQDYASSRWCLDELAQIMDYRKHKGQFVIPIFYNVDPSHVRNQTGAYKKAFEEHDQKYPDRVNRWRAALSEAANLCGTHCQPSTDEAKLIREIVADVVKKVESLHYGKGSSEDVIGMDEMTEPIEGLLEQFDRVGIWGMGGVGKTTTATAIFDKLSSSYYGSCCFLEDIREKTEKNGLEHVRKSLVSELLGPDVQGKPSNAEFVKRRLGSKKALVVLDDVDSSEQFKDLDHICNCLGEGSKIIITTRNKKLLDLHRGPNRYEIHEVKGLSYANSRQLFIREAFQSDDHPKDEYEQLIEGFVAYTQHNPLALKVLGSYVRSTDKTFWDGALGKLRAGRPHDEIQKVLRLSYDGLAFEEKQIFLDIACFLKGERETFVQALLESYGFHPTVGIPILKDKALIVTTNDDKVQMHDLLQEMGLQIVREENREPGKRSRLWDSSEIYKVLKYCKGENEVEGMMLDLREIKPLELTAQTFSKMTRLRFLKFYSTLFLSGNISIGEGLESISDEIRYFHWEKYPRKSLPLNFCAELLVELNIQESLVETFWEGVQELPKLKRLNLSRCDQLRELPDFSKARCLESVDLSGCDCLLDVHASLLSLPTLISLDVGWCESLKRLHSWNSLLKSLETRYCTSLEEFSVSSKELTSLDLNGTQIEELSPSIRCCSKLTTLSYIEGAKLKELPVGVLRFLTSLEDLSISLQNIDSVSLCNLTELFDCLLSLKSLALKDCCNLTEFPHNIKQLSSLQRLYLSGSRNLQYLPELPPSLQSLHVQDCKSLLLPNALSYLEHLQELYVKGCTVLWSLPQLPPSLETLTVDNCKSLEMMSFSMISSDNISYLSQLQYLFGCTALKSLPQLPSSLENLTVDYCKSLETVCFSIILSTSKNYYWMAFSCIDDSGAIEEFAKSLLQKAVHENQDVAFYFPRQKVPEWFGNNRALNDSDFVQLSLASHHLVGFVFCFVLPINDDDYDDYDSKPEPEVDLPREFEVEIEFGFELDEMTILEDRSFEVLSSGRCPENVILSSKPRLSELILEKIEGNRRKHEPTTDYIPNLFFKFYVRVGHYYGCFIKECGVLPVYAFT